MSGIQSDYPFTKSCGCRGNCSCKISATFTIPDVIGTASIIAAASQSPTPEMIETAAKAAYDTNEGHYKSWEEQGEGARKAFRDYAASAIAAYRKVIGATS